MSGAGSRTNGKTLIKTSQVIGKEPPTVEDAKFEVGKSIKHATVCKKTQREGAIRWVAANQAQTIRSHAVGTGDIFRMHDYEGIQLLCLLPEGIKLIAVIVLSVHIRTDVSTRELEVTDGMIKYLCSSARVLQR